MFVPANASKLGSGSFSDESNAECGVGGVIVAAFSSKEAAPSEDVLKAPVCQVGANKVDGGLAIM